nr:MAG TPA: hypothetical protein [Caudoviricetes sp.]
MFLFNILDMKHEITVNILSRYLQTITVSPFLDIQSFCNPYWIRVLEI